MEAPDADISSVYASSNHLLLFHIVISLLFPPPLQCFQASLADHMSVEICTVLPKFKLTMVLIGPRPAPEHEGREEETGDGASGSVVTETLKEDGHRGLAYVLHTSGTTGLPKIVRVPHMCILPNILHLRSALTALKRTLSFRHRYVVLTL